MALKRVWIASPNYSSRGSGVRLIVVHTSEGAQTYQSLGNFFANPSSQVSSHVGIDDTRGTIGEYVKREYKAWTAGNANPVAVQAELCTPSGAAANWTSETWINKHDNMLHNTADWIREEAAKYNIPIQALSPSQAQGSGRGVCQHSDLGSWGGGHYDCGNGFPMSYVINLAKGGSSKPPEPKFYYDSEEEEMQLVFDTGDPASDVAPACQLALGNQYSAGKHKLRFAAKDSTTLRVDFGSGKTTITVDAFSPNSVDIPNGKRDVVVKRDTGVSPVSVAISER